jgi:hypothetical protein
LKPPVIVYHLWPCEGWQASHAFFMGALVDCGLMAAAEQIIVGWAAPGDWIIREEVLAPGLPERTAIVPLRHGMNEIPTLDILHTLAGKEPDAPLLYLHCRGARYKPGDFVYQPVRDHNAMMVHFLVERWREALEALDHGFGLVGCNIQNEPYLHVSGNMHWSRSQAIAGIPAPRTLEDEVPTHDFLRRRNTAEEWPGLLGRAAMHELHGSGGVHHYQQRYPRERYAKPCRDGRALAAQHA